MKPILKAAYAALALPFLATSANAQNDIARNNYKVKVNATAELQTSVDGTTSVSIGTSDVISSILDFMGNLIPSGTKPSQCDIIAHYENNEDIVDEVEYYLVRTRGPSGGHFKLRLDPLIFDTEGDFTVFKRTFSANNTTVKATFWDHATEVMIDVPEFLILGSGLTKGNVTIKDVGTLNARLNQANANFDGSHFVNIDVNTSGVGTLMVKFGGALSNSVFDDLLQIFPAS